MNKQSEFMRVRINMRDVDIVMSREAFEKGQESEAVMKKLVTHLFDSWLDANFNHVVEIQKIE